MRISSNLSGALFMIAGMASFSINDAIVKKLTEEIGVGQIMFFRGLIVMVIALIIAWRAGVFSHMRAVLEPHVPPERLDMSIDVAARKSEGNFLYLNSRFWINYFF